MSHIPEQEPDHVFEDRSGIRGKVVVVLLAVLAIATVIWLWDLGRRLLIDVALPPVAPASESTARPQDAFVTLQSNAAEPCKRAPLAGAGRQRQVLGYLPAADSTAWTGLRSRCDQLDRVLADAFLLGAPDGTVVPLWARRNMALQELANEIGLPGGSALPVARITATTRTDELAALVSPGPALDKLVSQLAALLLEQPRPELCLDLGAHPDLDPAILREAFSRLARATTSPGHAPPTLCLIAGPEAGFWRDAVLVSRLDIAVVKAFRETASPLVAPAPPDWAEPALSEIRALIPAQKLVVALGSFGQAWQSGKGRSLRISYGEALARAHRAGLAPWFDPVSGATLLHFIGTDRQTNDIWLLDAASMHNQLATLPPDQSIAIWPLGYEDPAVWSLLQPNALGRPDHFGLSGPVDLSGQVLTETGGPALGGITPAVIGQRWVKLDPAGQFIQAEGYATLPLPNLAERRGVEQTGGLVLAFDGLPLDDDVDLLIAILAKHQVIAAFFADLPVLLERSRSAEKLVAAGHLLGLRQLPPLPDRPESRIPAQMELNFVQLYHVQHFGAPARLILLRPGAGPPKFSHDAFRAEIALLELGLISLRSSFDAPFGVVDTQDFADRIAREGDFDQTQVIALDLRYAGHDQIAALPDLLTRLLADGYQFLPPAAATRTEGSPPTATGLPDERIGDSIAFTVANFLLNGVMVLFFVMLVISAAFSLLYITLSLIRRPNGAIDPGFSPPVAVVIPAFNEEKVIAACVASVMRSDYPDFHVYIVDDGSTDRTAEAIRELIATNPRLHLLHEENAGKWHAANLALSEIDTPIFVVADADSIFLPDTIRWLVQPFRDKKVGAVAGLVEVGNRVNILTDFQHQEYMVTQNVLRRAHEFFDGILVVPGAVGAWRTKAVRESGGFSGETITEDADLTVAVHRAGYRVKFEERARSITEAPVTTRAFLRQRLRWQLGMLQVSWKHLGVVASGRPVGFSVVDSVWFGPVSLLLALLDDILLVSVVATAIYAIVLREALPGGALPILLFTSYFIMTGIEVLRTLTAFWFERRFEWKTLLLIPLLRFGYRQLLYITAIRGMFRALTGHPTGWYKIDRIGTRLQAGRHKSSG